MRRNNHSSSVILLSIRDVERREVPEKGDKAIEEVPLNTRVISLSPRRHFHMLDLLHAIDSGTRGRGSVLNGVGLSIVRTLE